MTFLLRSITCNTITKSQYKITYHNHEDGIFYVGRFRSPGRYFFTSQGWTHSLMCLHQYYILITDIDSWNTLRSMVKFDDW